MLGHRAGPSVTEHRKLTGKEKPVKLRQVVIRSEFIPSLSQKQGRGHRSVVRIFFTGFLNNSLSRQAFYIPAHVLQQPVLLAVDQASLQSTSAQLKLSSKILETKGFLPWFQGTRTSNWFQFVTSPSIHCLKAMKSGPQRLQNSLLIGVACGLRGILVPEFSLVPTGSEHRLVYMKW